MLCEVKQLVVDNVWFRKFIKHNWVEKIVLKFDLELSIAIRIVTLIWVCCKSYSDACLLISVVLCQWDRSYSKSSMAYLAKFLAVVIFLTSL